MSGANTERHVGHVPRILHVITHLDMGGAENVALALIDGLRDRVDFALFAVMQDGSPGAVGRDMAARLAAWRVPVRFGTRRGFKSGGVLIAARELARAVDTFRPDLIHVHTEVPELTLAVARLLSRRVRRTRVLRTVHNSTLWIDWHRLGRWVTRRLAGGDAVAVSSHAANADAAIDAGIPRPRAAVVYNGVAPPVTTVAARHADAPIRVLFAGRLVHQKGADLLPAILAEAHARTARRDVAVTIAGSGDMRDAVARGLDGRLDGWTVTMIGPIGGLAQRIAEYDVVLLPSRFEGFALLPLEVLMAGVPLVTTRAPGLDEAIPPDYPFHASPDDVTALGAVLAGVIDDPDAARSIAERHGAALAARFSPDGMASAYLSRYRAAVEPGDRQ